MKGIAKFILILFGPIILFNFVMSCISTNLMLVLGVPAGLFWGAYVSAKGW